MYRQIMNAIIEEFNTGLCRRDITNHWQCRCTVPGPGMRKAGQLLVERYLENGAASAEMIPYPADDRTEYLDGARNQMEWQPQSASLSVVSPEAETICRYDDEPLCLVCYSVATPPEGIEAEVVVHVGPLSADDVQEGQWAGKIVFTDQFPAHVAAAVGKSGAAGLISDCVAPPWLKQYPPYREPADVPDLVMWTIFSGRRDQPQIFGFNLSPRQGQRLRKLISDSPEPVRLRAVVDAQTVEGSSDFVHAVLPGTDLADEEIWVLAHLSEPGARDNASGCCACVELVRTLGKLIAEGKLPPLRRTIRFMHGVEVSGFLPYINEHKDRLPKVLAGLCADSVAENFKICGGQIMLFLSPEHNASFIDGLCQTLLAAVAAEPVRRFTSDNYATFPWITKPFWGNDAFISDGYFDIPAPQFSAWPDKHYHSNQDLPQDIDDNSLGRMGAVLGTYLYLLATAGPDEARWLGAVAAGDFRQRIARRISEMIAESLALPWTLEQATQASLEVWHLGLQGEDAVRQAGRFAPDDPEVAEYLQGLARHLCDCAGREAAEVLARFSPEPIIPPHAVPSLVEAEQGIPRRLRWHLPALSSLPQDVQERLERLREKHGLEAARLWPWINGRRHAGEILERLQFGGETPPGAVSACLAALRDAGLIEMITEQ